MTKTDDTSLPERKRGSGVKMVYDLCATRFST
jgi:hypothetical protein